MEVLTALIEATSVVGLVVYLAAMTLLLGTLAWANHLDHRRERGERQVPAATSRNNAWASLKGAI